MSFGEQNPLFVGPIFGTAPTQTAQAHRSNLVVTVVRIIGPLNTSPPTSSEKSSYRNPSMVFPALGLRGFSPIVNNPGGTTHELH